MEEMEEMEMPAMAKPPTISELVAMDDHSLMNILGMHTRLEAMKTSLAKLDTLTGKARAEAERQVASRLTPSIYESDFQYIYEDAKRATKSGKEEMDDPHPTPASVM